MKRHPLPLFFVLAFALPWFVWGTSIADVAGLIDWHVPPPLAFWIGLPVATFGTAFITGGWAATRDVLLRMVRWRVAPTTYPIALLASPLLVLVTIGIGFIIGQPARPESASVLAVLGAFAFNAWMWLITEEPAWRGFALPRLQRRMSPLAAAVLLGMVWAAWHVPLWFVPGSFQAQLPFVAFVLSTIATSVLMTWLFNRSRGSVLIAAIFHAATDVAIGVGAVMASGATLLWIFVALQVAAAVVCAPGLGRRAPSEALYPPLPD